MAVPRWSAGCSVAAVGTLASILALLDSLDPEKLLRSGGYILLFGGAQEMYVERYRRLVEERVLDLAANHPTVRAIAARIAHQELGYRLI